MKKLIEIFAMVISMGFVIVILVNFLIFPDRSMIFVEPIWWIRIPEIILGVFSIMVLTNMIINKISEAICN